MANGLRNASGSTRKARKPRPSRSRGLRATTGCLTCRKRRLKCDESRPVCGQCTKSSKDCSYGQEQTAQDSPSSEPDEASSSVQQPAGSQVDDAASTGDIVQKSPYPNAHAHVSLSRALSSTSRTFCGEVELNSPGAPQPQDTIRSLVSPREELIASPATQTSSTAPEAWFDSIARDAIKNIDSYNFLNNSGSRWSFETSSLSRNAPRSIAPFQHVRHSPSVSNSTINRSWIPHSGSTESHLGSEREPWTAVEPNVLPKEEYACLVHYVENVAPMLDLFDSDQAFGHEVPHLAMRNVGLLKSTLALAARHRSLISPKASPQDATGTTSHAKPYGSLHYEQIATRYYYETLSYLGQAMQYPTYVHSEEILTTAMMLSSYEALKIDVSEDWERHLKGVFWIQRGQDTDGESGGLRTAVWWLWLRQDTWAAFRTRRKPLTIWRPTKPLDCLSKEELARRSVYLLAKAVGYASEETQQNPDIAWRITEGDLLLQDLLDWHKHLPSSYRSLPSSNDASTEAVFPAIWIHPPIFAAAIQAHYGAKILVIANRPTVGGPQAWFRDGKLLDEAVSVICGIAQAPHTHRYESATFSLQMLYMAGLGVRTNEHQQALVRIFSRTMDNIRWPSKTLLDDLQALWDGME